MDADSKEWLRAARWLPALLVALLWLTLIGGLSLQILRAPRPVARDGLTALPRTDPPDIPAIPDAFDRATEQTLFTVAGLCFLLGTAVLFLVAHLVTVKRRLSAAERNIQTLRDVLLGVDGVSLR